MEIFPASNRPRNTAAGRFPRTSFFIAASHPFMGDLGLRERFEYPRIQDLGAAGSIEALNKCILIWLAWLDKAQFDTLAFAIE